MSKFSLETLMECVYPFTKTNDDDSVILGSTFGEDVALVQIGNDILLSHVDPIVGAVSGIGWLAMHVSCNDIACSGIPPKWAQILILVPNKEDTELVKTIMTDAAKAAEEIGVSIIGGHTGYSSGISRPVVAVTAMAPAGNHRTVGTKGAQTGDHVIITGGAGIEGTAILASDFTEEGKSLGLTDEEISEGARLGREISILKEAMILARHNATSMHDVTRGGIRETSLEIAKLSGRALEIDIDQIPARSIVTRFAQAFSFDPLGMISSGSIVATVPEKNVPEVIKELQMQDIPAKDAGIVKKGKGVTFIQEGREKTFENIHCEEDELARMWSIHKEKTR